MVRSKFSDSQIIDAIKRVESGIGVPDIRHESGVSTATLSEVSMCETNRGT